jgi:peptidyl-tRNA hydrolase
MGVSRPSKLYENNINENVSNWVLSDFTLDDKTKWLNSLINNISDNILLLINNDINNFLKNIK